MSGREARRIAEYQEQAARYMRIANECLAEGKDAEAEYAYQKGKWILENKCKGRRKVWPHLKRGRRNV